MNTPKVLIVEDSDETRFLLQTILRTEGYDVLLARTGQQALHLLKSKINFPDVILLDIALPDMSGYEVCEDIQSNAELTLIPVIMITGQHQAESQLQAFQLGAVGYLTKPIISDFLLEQVRKALKVRTDWQEHHLNPKEPVPNNAFNQAPPQEAPSKKSAHSNRDGSQSQFKNNVQPLKEQSREEPPHRATAENISSQNQKKLQPDIPEQRALIVRNISQNMNSAGTLSNFVKLLFSEQPEFNEIVFTPENLYAQAAEKGLSSERLIEQLSLYTGLPQLETLNPSSIRLGILPLPFCRKYHVIPISTEIDALAFALAHPFTMEVEDILRPHTQAPRYLIQPEKLDALFLSPHPGSDVVSGSMGELMAELQDNYFTSPHPKDHTAMPDVEEFEETEDPSSAPIVRLINRVIEEAYTKGASDIHIEAREDSVLVRYRIDGELRDQHLLKPADLIQPMVARLKIMANLNIAEKRLPQDGRIVFQNFTRRPLNFDLRMATSPMNFGEKVVLRIIDKAKNKLSLEDLGFSESNLSLYREHLKSPYGMILHVGPTGSGKSMTLYSALNEINSPDINIQTAEDPIEYSLPRINQLQVQPEIGMTFARALRAYLRQDPDVILVGEIRDPETAHISAEAALTGHLLFSTLHTNDAPSTLTRLIEMGVSSFMLSPSIVMICAQRLMRRLCQHCAQPYEASQSEKQLLGLSNSIATLKLYRSHGCSHCDRSGYKGRIGVHEILVPSERLRTALTDPTMSSDQLKKMAVGDGMITLYWDAMLKVRQGLSSLKEALRQVKPDGFDSCPDNWSL